MSGLPQADWTVDAGTTIVSTGVDRFLPANSRSVASPHVALPEPAAVARTSTLHAIRGALSGPTPNAGTFSGTTLTGTSRRPARHRGSAGIARRDAQLSQLRRAAQRRGC